jgi:hypothetical protein
LFGAGARLFETTPAGARRSAFRGCSVNPSRRDGVMNLSQI